MTEKYALYIGEDENGFVIRYGKKFNIHNSNGKHPVTYTEPTQIDFFQKSVDESNDSSPLEQLTKLESREHLPLSGLLSAISRIPVTILQSDITLVWQDDINLNQTYRGAIESIIDRLKEFAGDSGRLYQLVREERKKQQKFLDGFVFKSGKQKCSSKNYLNSPRNS